MRIRFLAKQKAVNLHDLDDQQLLAEYRESGNQECIAILMDRYAGQIVAFGLKQLRDGEDVRDFANDVYLKLTEKLRATEPRNFSSWLYVFMRNMCHDIGRRQQLTDQFVAAKTQEGIPFEEAPELEKEEYIEQAYFFQIMSERLNVIAPMQDLLKQLKHELQERAIL